MVDQGIPSYFTNNKDCCPCCLSEVKGKPTIAKDTILLGHRTRIIQAESSLKVSFLWSSFHSTRKYYGSCNSSTQLWHIWTITWQNIHKYAVSKTSFDKHTTCQGRGMGMSVKTQVKTIKQEPRGVAGGSSWEYWNSPAVNFPSTFIPQYNRGGGRIKRLL